LNEFTPQVWLSFLLGAAFATIVAGARLRGPEADRSYTTFYRYSVATAYFSLGNLAVYMLALCGLWAAYQFEPGSPVDYLIQSPGWIAIFTAGVLPRLKPFTSLDNLFRSHARRIGGMPDEALVLRDAIVAAKRSLTERDRSEIHFELLRRGLDLGRQRQQPDNTLHAQFQHAAELKFLLEKCMHQRRNLAFARENARALQLLTRRFDHLMFRSSRSSEAIGQLHELADSVSGASGNWEALGALVENQAYGGSTSSALNPASSTSRMLVGNLRDDMRYFCNDAALLLARLTLYKRRTEGSRVRFLHQFGLQITPVARPHFRSLGAVFTVVFIAMWIAGVVRSTSASPSEAMGLLVMIPTIFVTALLCAVYPKQYFAFANVDIYGRKPYWFYIAAGLAATVLAFVIGLVIRMIRLQDGEQALNNAIQNSPWLFVTFTLAFVMAILVQDTYGTRDDKHDALRSWRDAIWVAAAMGAAMILAQSLLPLTRPTYSPNYWMAALNMAIGAFIGYYVPKRFRNIYAMSANDRRPVVHPTWVGEAVRFMKGSPQ
jgi:hypothetical protein